MRLRTLTAICLILGVLLLVGYPSVISKNPVYAGGTSHASHHTIQLFEVYFLSYSLACTLFMVAAIAFSCVLILEAKEVFEQKRKVREYQFIFETQRELAEKMDQKKDPEA